MKVIPIHKKKDELQQLLETFRKSLEVADFLAAVEYCLKNRIEDCSVLEAEWEAQQQKVLFTDGMESLSKLLAKIKVEYPSVEKVIAEKTETELKQSLQLQETLEAFSKQEEERKVYSDKYAWFEPAFMARKVLPEIYPAELDPGLIIGRYLHQLFPDASDFFDDLAAPYVSAKEYPLCFTSSFHGFAVALGCSVVLNTHDDEHEQLIICHCLMDILDPENRDKRSQSFSSQDLLQKVMFTPREFFYSWYSVWLSHHYDFPASFDEEIMFANSLSALKMLPFGKGELPIVGKLAKADANLSEEGKKGILKLLDKIALDKYVPLDDLFEWIYFNYAEAYYDDDDYNETVILHLKSFTEYRRKHLAGMFPTDSWLCARVASNIVDFIGAEQTDLLVLLTDAYYESSVLCMQIDDDKTSKQKSDFLDKAQERYICLFNKTVEEGLPEFAVALLSFYLFFRAILAKGRFGNLHKLMPTIEHALSLPGSKVLKYTLSFVVESIDEYFSDNPIAACSAAYFKPYLPKQAELHSIEGGNKEPFGSRQSEKSVREFFEAELGVERWEKLSQNSQKCLVSAELQWRNSAIEFGFGIKDWSGLITTYCKAIEGELVGRLHDFFVSPEYEAYLADKSLKRPAKPTAGWLLKELKSYEQMPPELQAVLCNTKINIAGDKDLINRLYDIVQNYRNISAHHDAVSMKRYAEFKEKLFQSDLLHRFIDAFHE